MKYSFLLFLIFPTLLFCQDIDADRMNRDIKVAENGLKSLLDLDRTAIMSSGQSAFFRLNRNNIEGQYIKDYGVVMTADICEPCLTSKIKNKQKKKSTVQEDFNLSEHLIDAAKTFLADYGSIIGQLKPTHKIMIRYGDNSEEELFKVFGFARDGEIETETVIGERNDQDQPVIATTIRGGVVQPNRQEITVEVSVKDINNHMAGTLGRDDLIQKMVIDVQTISNEKDPQLETFTAMFHRLYQRDLSSTYFMSSKPKYSKISNVGIIMKARVYSSNVFDNDRYSIPTQNKEDLSLEERNSIVADMLPEFEKVFKENIVSYARTIRSLEKGNTIMFEVRMTECKGCYDFPKYINFTINKETLDQFNKGKISFEQAVNKVTVERKSA